MTALAVAFSIAMMVLVALRPLATSAAPESTPTVPRDTTPIAVCTTPRPATAGVMHVSKSTGLNPAGEAVRVTGSGFYECYGVYIAFCVMPPAGQLPTPCGGGADIEGDTGASKWVSSYPPAYGVGLAIPYGANGSFDVSLAVSPVINADIDCRWVQCAVVVRNDHTRTDDRSQDVIIPIFFGEATTTTTAPTTAAPTTASPTTAAPTTAAPVTTARPAATTVPATTQPAIPVATTTTVAVVADASSSSSSSTTGPSTTVAPSTTTTTAAASTTSSTSSTTTTVNGTTTTSVVAGADGDDDGSGGSGMAIGAAVGLIAVAGAGGFALWRRRLATAAGVGLLDAGAVMATDDATPTAGIASVPDDAVEPADPQGEPGSDVHGE